MRKLLNRKIAEQNRQCAICEVAFASYNDIVPDHIDPRGMGGSRRDDHPENIQAVHFWCNGDTSSSAIILCTSASISTSCNLVKASIVLASAAQGPFRHPGTRQEEGGPLGWGPPMMRRPMRFGRRASLHNGYKF